jgi:hypothetical protein
VDASQPRNLAPDLRPGLKHKLEWRWNRLRCMSPAEVVHRVLRAVQARAERSGWVRAPVAPPPDAGAPTRPWVHADAQVDAARYRAAADRIAEGWLDVFALRDVDLGSPPRWNRDPKTGIEAPLEFGKLLDYRDPDVVGDIKYLWEPNRHLHLVTLAQAFALTGERKYFDVAAEHLDSWFLACPYGQGPNWSSALEVAIRLANWSVAWQLFGFSKYPSDFQARWLRSVYQHAEFVSGWLSKHSSANNHLIGEAAGLYLAALTWPCWPRAQGWLAQARSVLEREALAQNAPDGVNREQAVAYQQFVLEMLLACLLAGRAAGANAGQPFSEAYEARIESMMDFLASIMDAGGNLPMFGDADDGVLLGLEPGGFAACRPLLAAGAILFGRGDFKLKAGVLDDRTRWLLGRDAQRRFDAIDAEKTRLPLRQTFPEGGYFVLGCGFDGPGEIRVVADAGPLGYRSIAAHGHADALSFTLSAGGRELLVDPGTYAYHTHPVWRHYFRGTGAHNTVRIDGLDQSVSGGNFMWLAKARAGCSLWLSSADKDSFEGWHDGYMRLEDPVKHRRLIELDKKSRRVVIEDTLEMEEDHEVELFFHCSELCSAEQVADGVLVTQENVGLKIRLPETQHPTIGVFHGSVAPICGWVSRAFDRRIPAPTVVWRARLTGNVVLRTEMTITTKEVSNAG